MSYLGTLVMFIQVFGLFSVCYTLFLLWFDIQTMISIFLEQKYSYLICNSTNLFSHDRFLASIYSGFYIIIYCSVSWHKNLFTQNVPCFYHFYISEICCGILEWLLQISVFNNIFLINFFFNFYLCKDVQWYHMVKYNIIIREKWHQ